MQISKLFKHTILFGFVVSNLLYSHGSVNAVDFSGLTDQQYSERDNILANARIFFEQNVGQVDPEVKFISRTQGYTTFIRDNGSYIQVNELGLNKNLINMEFIGSSGGETTGLGQLITKVNYFTGSVESWKSNISTFGKVVTKNIYPGIDQVYYADASNQVESDFIVSPYVDPSTIKIRFTGIDFPSISPNGELVLNFGDDKKFVLSKPFTYQLDGDDMKEVYSSYTIDDSQVVSFSVGNYDKSKNLIIDPSLEYLSYVGGLSNDQVNGITVDSGNNLYVTGYTESTNFPTLNPYDPSYNGSGDAFVLKFDNSGSQLVYATYFGSTSSDKGLSVAVDDLGNAYVTGEAGFGTSFPTTANRISFCNRGSGVNSFISKFNSTGSSLVYSTCIGGTGGNSIVVSQSGEAHVGGYDERGSLITSNPLQLQRAGNDTTKEAYYAKLNSDGSALVFSSYLGGSGNEIARDISLDLSGNLYITGETDSLDFPIANAVNSTPNGSIDAFITKINQSGTAYTYSTYYGGNSADFSTGITNDLDGNSYISGITQSSNFPLVNPLVINGQMGNGAFFVKLSSNGSTVINSTTFGGIPGSANARAIAIDDDRNIYFSGGTSSSNFPLVDPLYNYSGFNEDAYVLKLSSSGTQILFSTYLGGNDRDMSTSIALDGNANIYVGGLTISSNLPVINPFQSTYGGGEFNGFVAKIIMNEPPTVDAGGVYSVGEGSNVMVSATGNDPDGDTLTYAWDLDNDNVFETAGQSVLFSASNLDGPGSQLINVQVSDGIDVASDQAIVNISNVSPTALFANSSGVINEDSTANLQFSNQFDPGTLDTSTGFLYSYDCTNDGVFEIIDVVSSSNNCLYTDPGTYSAKGRINDKDSGSTVYTVTVSVSDIPTVDDFVLLGKEGVWLKQGAVVNSGDVGADTVSAGPFLDSGVEVSIGNSALITNIDSAVFGDDVHLKAGSQVNEASYNALTGSGTILGSSFSPLSLPLVSAFPAVPTFSPGIVDIDVPQNTTQTITSGSYRDLIVRSGAIVIFSGGTYEFNSWDIRDDAKLYFSTGSEVRITSKVDTRLRVEIGPEPASAITSADILIISTGINGNSGNIGAAPKAVEFGRFNLVNANVYAPNGTLWFKDNTDAIGAFIGKWVILGQDSTATHVNGF